MTDTERGGSTPEQYELPEWATELQDLIEYRNMNFAIGNIFKACYRMGIKNDNLYEINKILWFAEREKARLIAVRNASDCHAENNRVFSADGSGNTTIVDDLMSKFGMKP